MQGGETLIVRRIHVGAPAQEQIHTRGIALVCCPHERCVGLRIGDVNGNILVQEQDELVDIAVERGRVEQIEALVVGEEWVGAVFEEEVYDVVVAAFGGPEDGRCNGVAAFGVEGCARLDEEVAEGVVVVDRGPLRTGQQYAHMSSPVYAHAAVLCPARLCTSHRTCPCRTASGWRRSLPDAPAA